MTYDEVKNIYPALCYCTPGGLEGVCWYCTRGHRRRLTRLTQIIYVMPLATWWALRYLKVGYMKKFYVDDYPSASIDIIAFSSVLAVVVDAFFDPKFAGLTDRIRTRWGRRRPFFFFLAFI